MRGKTLSAALIGLLTAAGLALVPLTTTAQAGTPASAAVPAPAKAGPIDWGRCKDRDLRQAKAKCGMLTVPLDHANPAGPTIKLAVSRVKHTKGPYRGAVFTNPGGPGGSGVFYSTLGQYVPKGVGLTYDWYGIDPRGVGASRPALTCDAKYFKWNREPYTPTTQTILDYWLNRTQGYAADCGSAKAAALLPHLKTTDTVADLELLRQAIGEDQVTFYGFSYGTYIAQVYATLHPTSLKAMVLDGVVDATRAWYPANIDQDYAFEKTVAKFFAWVAKYNSVYHLGATKKAVERRYQKLHKQVTKHPADGKVGPSELDDAILPAGYYNLTWLEVGQAFADLANDGDARGIKALYRSGNPTGKRADNGYAIYAATECTDAPWPTDWATWSSDMKAVDQQAPFYTWGNAWFNAPCRTWPAPAAAKFNVSGAAYHGPVLLTSETLDAATPFSGALATRALFPTSALVEGVRGTSHAVTLFGVSCTDNAIAAVLKNGTLPSRKAGDRSDKKCPPLAAPDPRSADDRAAARAAVALVARLPIPFR